MVFILDREGTVRFINRPAAAMLGRKPEDIVGRKQADFFPKEGSRHGASVAQVFASGSMKVSESLYYDLPSGPRWLDNRLIPLKNDRGETTHVLGISRDVTERRRIEASLQNAQKLESLGVLAGGIAHDFNNLLTAQFGYIELAQSRVPPDSEAHALLERGALGLRQDQGSHPAAPHVRQGRPPEDGDRRSRADPASDRALQLERRQRLGRVRPGAGSVALRHRW